MKQVEERFESTEKEEAYHDRNLAVQLAAYLAHQLDLGVGVKKDLKDKDFVILYIDLPTGQVSWHIPKDEYFDWYDPYDKKWDGHNLAEKQKRIRQFLTPEWPKELRERILTCLTQLTSIVGNHFPWCDSYLSVEECTCGMKNLDRAKRWLLPKD